MLYNLRRAGHELKFKALDIRHHFLLERVCQRDIKVVQVPSEFQHTDIDQGFSIRFVCVSPKIPNDFEVIFSLDDW